MARRYSGDLQEQEAYEYHKKVYDGIHTFYIRDIEEYIRLRPIILMIHTNAKVIAKGKLEIYKAAIKRKSIVAQDKTLPKVKSKRGYLYPSIRIKSNKTDKIYRRKG